MAVARSAAWLPSVVGGRTGGGAHLAGHRDIRVRVEGVLHPGRARAPRHPQRMAWCPPCGCSTGSVAGGSAAAAAAGAAVAYLGSAAGCAAALPLRCRCAALARPSPSRRPWPGFGCPLQNMHPATCTAVVPHLLDLAPDGALLDQVARHAARTLNGTRAKREERGRSRHGRGARRSSHGRVVTPHDRGVYHGRPSARVFYLIRVRRAAIAPPSRSPRARSAPRRRRRRGRARCGTWSTACPGGARRRPRA